MARYIRNEDLPTGTVDEELILLDMEQGACFGFDKVGTAIWALLDRPMTRDAIAAELTRDYAVSASQAAADIAPFLDALVNAKLVRRA